MKIHNAVHRTNRTFVQVNSGARDGIAKLGYCSGVGFEGKNRCLRHGAQQFGGSLSTVSTHFDDHGVDLPDALPYLRGGQSSGCDWKVCAIDQFLMLHSYQMCELRSLVPGMPT